MLCTVCGNYLSYNEIFDAYFCKICDKWSEPTCRIECLFCQNRPNTPSQVHKMDKLIKKVEKDVKKGKKKKAMKDIIVLKKADKKFDKKIEKAEKMKGKC